MGLKSAMWDYIGTKILNRHMDKKILPFTSLAAAMFAFLLISLQPVDASTSPASSAAFYHQRSIASVRGQAVIASVPQEDRGMFVIYQLAKALNADGKGGNTIKPWLKVEPQIPQKKSLAFKDIQTYSKFPADLLKWTMRTFGLSRTDVYTLVRRRKVLCTVKGLCFNPNDIGTMCCPF